ncbi:MAG TPA: alpha/beta hydrolase [Methylomirabilota bacterium]|nr:alpha/beta hydrolase [Methylomirabilota bacterium]
MLFHSLLTDRSVFDGVVPALAARHRVTLVNLPGFGESSPAGPGIEDYADRMALLFAALRLPPATDLVAMSFGGFVGLALAARHRELVERLVLVDTAAAFPEHAKLPLRRMAERALHEGMKAVVDTALHRMFTDAFIAAHPEVVSQRSQVLLRARPDAFATACRALADLDLRPALPGIRHRALVIVGALDTTTPPALANELAAGLEGAGYVEIADCAHCPPLERPEIFVRTVLRFLDDSPTC